MVVDIISDNLVVMRLCAEGRMLKKTKFTAEFIMMYFTSIQSVDLGLELALLKYSCIFAE